MFEFMISVVWSDGTKTNDPVWAADDKHAVASLHAYYKYQTVTIVGMIAIPLFVNMDENDDVTQLIALKNAPTFLTR